MGGTARRRELRRRRHRRRQMAKLTAKVEKASPAEKQEIARKIRELTPGSDAILDKLKIK